MALSVTIDGFCRLGDNSLSNSNVKYQGLFYPNGTASSSTTWNNVRTVEGTGYYNINLGDGDWLGQDGTALNNSKVIVVFWKGTPLGDDRNALCGVLEEWGAFEIIIDGSDVYTNLTQTKPNIGPSLAWLFPDTGYVNTDYSSTHTSYDIHNWTISGTTMYHWRARYGENIQLINTVSGTSYYWDDGADDHYAGVSTGTHQWSSPGIYDVKIVIYDECSATATGIEQIQIYSHAPTCGIELNEATGQNVTTPDTALGFEYDGTDVDDTITEIYWKINDSGAYGNTDTTVSGVSVSGTVYHSNGQGTDWCSHTSTSGAFTNPGNHLIETCISWNDGFDDNVLYCSETFNQQQFSGPAVDFNQAPSQATVGSGVKFVNSSTNVSRVGLGLPDCEEYEWSWDDDGNTTTYSDKPYSYELTATGTSANCSVRLCADYSDGWDTQVTCEEKDVVFETTVDVTEVECYYNLNIVGTSDDGSVTGYNWEIEKYTTYSGSGEPSPTESGTLLWTSPTGMDQQDKKVCFTSTGWYKIEGFVHGTGATTSDYEPLEITEVCVTSGIAECTLVIWNGTGVDDIGGDWSHGGQGTEETYAKYSGTNGLDASSLSKNDIIQFTEASSVDIGGYDLLAMWVNVKNWETDKLIEVQFSGNGSWMGNSVNLNAYINTGILDTWQRALIPFADLGLSATGSIEVNKLRLRASGNTGIYLDNVEVVVGTVAYTAVPICTPDIDVDEYGSIHIKGKELKPGVIPELEELVPDLDSREEELKPDMRGQGINPPKLKAFPTPNDS